MKPTLQVLIKVTLTCLLVCTFAFTAKGQKKMDFTPYDSLPSINSILKPTYSNDMPDWGKMLYQYPVNFNEITRAFNLWVKNQKADKHENISTEEENENETNAFPSLVRYYKIWHRRLGEYADGNGNIVLPDFHAVEGTAKQNAVSLKRNVRTVGNTSNWTFLGPKQTFWLNESGSSTAPNACPWQANVYAFDVTNNNPNVLYAGTETGFVNKSVDKGQTWTMLGQDYSFGGAIEAVAINPNNTDTVYVAAGKAIHKSFDGGKTWAKFNLGTNANRLKIDYTNTSKLIASCDGGFVISNDKGKTWAKKVTMPCWDVEFKPNSSDTIYTLTETDKTHYFRIMQSTNGGNSFDSIATFPKTIPQRSGGLLAMTPKNPNIMYVVMLSADASGTEKPYIYKGTLSNGVWNWELKYTGYTGMISGSGLTNGQGYFDLVLEASPLDENLILVGTTSIFKSTNGGSTLTAVGGYVGPFSVHPDQQDMKMLANGETWLATDGGFTLTTDNFTNLANATAFNNGLIGSDFWGFDQGWNEDLIVSGRYHNGNTAIADFYGDKALRMGGGESPTGWVVQGKSRTVAFNDLGNGWVLPKTAEGKPEGRFVFSKYPNMDGYGSRRSNLVAHPNYSGTLYCGTDSTLWISSDYGVTYDMLYRFPGKVRYFNISVSNPNVMYADILSYGFYRSSDGGVTWTKKTNPGFVSGGGDLNFAISPYNENVIYACFQDNTSRSAVYRSTNGGSSWSSWSNFSGLKIKCLVIQPTTEGKDLVYAFVSNNGFVNATAYFRKDGDAAWTLFNTNFPASFSVNLALPFFRDSKIRVGGNGGVWESPLAEPDFTPIIVPWLNKRVYQNAECSKDTVQFDDHSLLNQKGVSWNWSFSNPPAYISNANSRNPKALFNIPGKYTATLTVTTPNGTYVKTATDLFEVKSCPSINDCSNPGNVPKTDWKLISANSQSSSNPATNAFDELPYTYWGTRLTAKYPHELKIDLAKSYNLSKIIYTPRSETSIGQIKDFELYISNDTTTAAGWGDPVLTGSFTNPSVTNTLSFPVTQGRYVRLKALNSIDNSSVAYISELGFVGCNVTTGLNDLIFGSTLKAFPVPATSKITVTLPFNDGLNSYTCSVYSADGRRLYTVQPQVNDTEFSFNVDNYPAGNYFVTILDKNGTMFRAKFVKK